MDELINPFKKSISFKVPLATFKYVVIFTFYVIGSRDVKCFHYNLL